MIKKILIALLAAFIVIQFFRPEKNLNNSAKETLAQNLNAPDSIMNILKVSCYDCHSNKTNYYWYHEIMPFGWWLSKHVKDGKRHLNFSEFYLTDKKKMDHRWEEIAEEVKEHEMPLSSYTLVHKEAALSTQQIKILTDWVANERSQITQIKK